MPVRRFMRTVQNADRPLSAGTSRAGIENDMTAVTVFLTENVTAVTFHFPGDSV